MVIAGRVILPFLLIILIRKNVEAKNQLEVITDYYNKLHRAPLILLIDRVSRPKNGLRTSNDKLANKEDLTLSVDNEDSGFMHYVNAILRSTGDENDPSVIKTKYTFENALRSRCQKYLDCEVKCKPKKKEKCKNKCKELYDNFKICNEEKPKFPVKTNREVYEYLKKNPPTRSTKDYRSTTKDRCEPSDECEEKNSCDESNDC